MNQGRPRDRPGAPSAAQRRAPLLGACRMKLVVGWRAVLQVHRRRGAGKAWPLALWEMVGRVGFEPTTYGLKVHPIKANLH